MPSHTSSKHEIVRTGTLTEQVPRAIDSRAHIHMWTQRSLQCVLGLDKGAPRTHRQNGVARVYRIRIRSYLLLLLFIRLVKDYRKHDR